MNTRENQNLRRTHEINKVMKIHEKENLLTSQKFGLVRGPKVDFHSHFFLLLVAVS